MHFSLLQCPHGKFSFIIGSTSCTDRCPAGQYYEDLFCKPVRFIVISLVCMMLREEQLRLSI